MEKQTKKQTKRQSRGMRLEEHIADTLKEWELKLGKIDGGIRLYYPCDSIREYLGQAYTVAQGEDLAECVRRYLQTEATYFGPVKTGYHEGRIAVQIPEEGCQYVAEQMEYPELLVRLLACLKEGSLEKIRNLFETYAGGTGWTGM